ncbi:22060_t:CDS:1, partial [Racocetra persica]
AQVPSGTRCLQAIFYPASGPGYTITKFLYVDLLDRQGYFYFGDNGLWKIDQ